MTILMAVVMVFCTVGTMAVPASALEGETSCGMSEHTHGDSCYESVLSCGQEEGETHTHSDSCYQRTLTCQTPEHTHNDGCYVNSNSETESETGSETETGGTVPTEIASESEAESTETSTETGTEESSETVTETSTEETSGETETETETETELETETETETELETETETETETEIETETETEPVEEAAALPDGAQIPEGYTEQYTSRDGGNGFAVTVYAPEGVVPEGAVLTVRMLDEGEDAYVAAEAALPEDSDASYGFAAMDIHFEDENGGEVEPGGSVYVVVNAAGLLPDDANPDTVIVQHHIQQDGNVNVETVADTGDAASGVVETQSNDVRAAFEVSGFSTFTFQWQYNTESEEETDLPDGLQIPEGYTEKYTFRDDENGFVVTVYAPKGVVPDGAVLTARLLEESDEDYIAAEEALAEDGVAALSENGEEATYDLAAMDIHFEDEEGNEVEPEGDVYVVIDAAGLLPEDVDPDTVSVQHHMEQDNGEVAVETVADAGDATDGVVKTSNNDVQAAFEVSGFSTFTISWGNNFWPRFEVYYGQIVDNKVTELQVNGANSSVVRFSSDDTIESFDAPEVDGYDYTGEAYVVETNGRGDTTQTQIYDLSYGRSNNQRGEWQYNTSPQGNNDGWVPLEDKDVYFIYESTAELTTVDTVDSTAEGVHMYMFDYGNAAFSGGGYGSGDVKEGLAGATVDKNGWPHLSSGGSSFSNFFGQSASAYNVDSANAVNHLFLKSKFDEDGTFYYSSFENFATLKNDSDSNFTVYEQLGTPSNEDEYFYQRGNFMPYNTLDPGNVRNQNLYSDTGESLNQSDPRYNEDIYGFNEADNFYFGMYIWADFYQPENGQVTNNAGTSSEDMIFEFTGDDDLWVYIDGVLVLDLGGIHDAQSGYINFASGQIGYTDTETGEDPDWHYTTLRSMYESAGEGQSVNWDGDTFADGSSHRIQIFYMERGAGASNLKISFNLKTIPDGQLSVRKEVENYYAPQLADIEYTMQVTVNGAPYANQSYTYYEQQGGGTTDENGRFKLKYGQTAIFSDLTVNDIVTVKEIDSSDTETGSSISQNYDISYTVTDGAGNTTGSEGQDGIVTATMPGYGSIQVTVTNTATYTRPLKLVKNFDGTPNNAAPEGFEATYTLYEQATGNGGVAVWEPVGSIKYSDLENGEYIFWLDVEKNYKIEETFGAGDSNGETTELPWLGVETTTNDPARGTDASEGIVYLETNDATEGNGIDTITMTNRYGDPTVSLTIIKNIYGLDGEHVEGLINGDYRSDGGLKFDVDYFNSQVGASSDDYGNKDVFIGDWTFSAQQTLDPGDDLADDIWSGLIQTGEEDIKINEENGAEHYGNSSLKKITTGDETYYQYTITISDIDPDDWYHVWETHVDVSGYQLESSVAASHNDGSDITTYTTNHVNRSTAFQLTQDTTVTFTNRYTLNEFTVTKVDATNNTTKLPGAEFYLQNSNEEYYSYNDETKLTDWVDSQAKATKLTSSAVEGGTYGTFTIYGLEDGSYSLIEVKAPDGYKLPESNFTFTVENGVISSVSSGNASKDTTLTVTNEAGYELPETGGAGTTMNTIGGLFLMTAAAGGGYGLRRRRGKEAE